MAGLFGLFGKKNNNVEDSYFLNPDDAKTFGDIDYMRTAKTTRRTFPKVQGGKGAELIQEVSSEKMTKKNSNEAIKPKSSSSNFSDPNSSFTPQENRKTDTNMNMFRDMAKKIKK
ncbi:hypothetical protein [Geminocystis sp. GBBB08]|uniref:hypothetical protein n=1 Tax=Geminocystis sp. GBBB08 TaxID=2604140 RepID=UPI0027E33897|nr:hypothetical protein [Geminocystis sp. GBBB08]MBL1209416.1 hypothetical protein [Geminocystis sp. GBBB08]